MKANIGDKIIVGSPRVGIPDKVGEVVEVRGENGAPPYVVRWSDDAHEGLFFPSAGTTVQPASRRSG
jgi:hypothetical protein